MDRYGRDRTFGAFGRGQTTGLFDRVLTFFAGEFEVISLAPIDIGANFDNSHLSTWLDRHDSSNGGPLAAFLKVLRACFSCSADLW